MMSPAKTSTTIENMSQKIFLYKRGEITPQDKTELKAAGFLPVSCKDINNVAIMFPDLQKIKGDEIMNAALAAIMSSSVAPTEFGKLMVKALSKK